MPSSKKQNSKEEAKMDEPLGFTPERFEQELKDLASKAKADTWGNHVLGQIVLYTKTIVLLSLLGVYSNVSQLALSPVYGSIPPVTWHSKTLMAGCFIGWAGNVAFRQILPVKTVQLLPLVAVFVPMVQFFLFKLSQTLGSQFGPLVTEISTLFPLAILTASSVADNLEDADFSSLPKVVAEAIPGIGSWGLFKLVEHIAEHHLRRNVGRVFLYTRMGMEILLAASYAVFAPSKYFVLAIPALLHTAMFNTHVLTPSATAALNSTLMMEKWIVLDRRESVTGYISVIENTAEHFRLLRADHSILGGDWVEWRGNEVGEPVYAVFVMLEAVRLVKRETPVADVDAKALVIGLGIGTTPSAFVAHGIDTTVVEIDPVVHEFAVQHFELRENNLVVIEDAVAYTNRLVNQSKIAAYDYIVHDVFTGGAEPVNLFTVEFLENLSALLKPDGVIAINYAGDLALPAPKIVTRTILQVFPTCRIFREDAAKAEEFAKTGADFTNMVIFCRKTLSPVDFRPAEQADYLRSRSRAAFLQPEHELLPQDLFAIGKDEEGSILRKNATDKVTEGHKVSAAGHWAIMRGVITPFVWENW